MEHRGPAGVLLALLATGCQRPQAGAPVESVDALPVAPAADAQEPADVGADQAPPDRPGDGPAVVEDAPAPPDVPADGTPGDLAMGPDKPTPREAGLICLYAGSACAADFECCDRACVNGVCCTSGDSCGAKGCCGRKCLGGTGGSFCCYPPHHPCDLGSECCTGSCRGGAGFQQGSCACREQGQACVTSTDCCVGWCRSGTCVCGARHEPCARDLDCCSSTCKDYGCL
jgi:hypothetical protein